MRFYRESRGHKERLPAVIIAGVDSYLSSQTLKGYEERSRLFTSENSNGFIPGEGASAMIVRRPLPSEHPQLVLMGLGFGVEKATLESEEPLRADGLAGAIKNSIAEAGIDLGSLDYRITDVSGEHVWLPVVWEPRNGVPAIAASTDQPQWFCSRHHSEQISALFVGTFVAPAALAIDGNTRPKLLKTVCDPRLDGTW